jgi:vacuolar-type H+-ATPase subunit D/Vma8
MRKATPTRQDLIYGISDQINSEMDMKVLKQKQKDLMRMHIQVQESIQNIENKLTKVNTTSKVSFKPQLFMHGITDSDYRGYMSENSIELGGSHCKSPDMRMFK